MEVGFPRKRKKIYRVTKLLGAQSLISIGFDSFPAFTQPVEAFVLGERGGATDSKLCHSHNRLLLAGCVAVSC